MEDEVIVIDFDGFFDCIVCFLILVDNYFGVFGFEGIVFVVCGGFGYYGWGSDIILIFYFFDFDKCELKDFVGVGQVVFFVDCKKVVICLGSLLCFFDVKFGV